MKAKALLLIGVLLLVCTVSAFDYNIGDWNGGINTSTVLMLHPYGENGSTSITDNSIYAKGVTVGGNVTIFNTSFVYPNYSTSATFHNGTAIFFDGFYTSNITVPDSSDWAFGTGDFTIDFWECPNSITLRPYLISQGSTSANRWYIRHENTGSYTFVSTSGGTTIASYATPSIYASTNVWRHVLFQRKGSTANFYINGVDAGTIETVSFDAKTSPDIASVLTIGTYASSVTLDGYLEEVRITKGIARMPSLNGPMPRTSPYTNWNDTTISGVYFQAVPKTVTYLAPFNYTVYARNVSNVSYLNVNLSFPTHSLRADNVYFNDTQFNTLTAIVNNASALGFVNVNITNQTWLANLSSGNPGVFDVQFRYINGTSFGPANVTVSVQSFWNGNYSVVNSGNFYFRDNVNGDIIPAEIPPIANFVANKTYGVKPLTVQFNDTSNNGPVASWFWQFGDGSTSAVQNNTYIYTIAGNYTVNLTASNAVGSNMQQMLITVLNSTPPSLIADFVASNVNPAVSESITFTDLTTDSPNTWNWSFGDGTNSSLQNPSHAYSTTGLKTVFLNVTNASGYYNMTTKLNYINVTVNGTPSITTTDIVMEPQYLLTLHVTASDTGLPITNATVLDSLGLTYTTTNGTFYMTYPFSTVVVEASAGGYSTKQASYVIDNDTEQTIQLSPAPSVSNRNTWYTPHQVRFAIVDTRDNKLVGVTVNATADAATFPTGATADWLTQMYGIDPNAANDMLNGTLIMQGNTGGDGSTTFTMHSSIGYTMRIYNPANGVTHTTTVNPIDSLYTIRIAGTTINNTFTDMGYNTSLFITEPNTSYVTMNMRYQDNSSKTTWLDFYVLAKINNTIINHQVFTGFGNSQVLANYTVKNVRAQEYAWYYNAVRNP